MAVRSMFKTVRLRPEVRKNALSTQFAPFERSRTALGSSSAEVFMFIGILEL